MSRDEARHLLGVALDAHRRAEAHHRKAAARFDRLGLTDRAEVERQRADAERRLHESASRRSEI